MSTSRRLAVFALLLVALVPVSAHAENQPVRESASPLLLIVPAGAIVELVPRAALPVPGSDSAVGSIESRHEEGVVGVGIIAPVASTARLSNAPPFAASNTLGTNTNTNTNTSSNSLTTTNTISPSAIGLATAPSPLVASLPTEPAYVLPAITHVSHEGLFRSTRRDRHDQLDEARRLSWSSLPSPTRAEALVADIERAATVRSVVVPSRGTTRAPAVRHLAAGRSGLSAAEWAIVGRESRGRVSAKNPRSSAFGVGQLLIGNRVRYAPRCGVSAFSRSYGAQLCMMRAYIADRYGSAERALAHHRRRGWY